MLPPTALDLMRSRYSAYALSKVSYIIETTHPQSPYFEKDVSKWEKGVRQFCNTTRFVKLEILHPKYPDPSDPTVHFIAYLEQGAPFQLNEKSHFEKLDGKWLYLSGSFTN